jgi:HEAT repeat protein
MKSLLRNLLLVGCPIVICTACSKSPPPTLSGGKSVAHWIDALQSPDVSVRKEAVYKLGNIGDSNPDAPAALIAALGDRDAKVRREAIVALLKAEIAVKEAAPKLREIQARDPDLNVRAAAGQALTRIGAVP